MNKLFLSMIFALSSVSLQAQSFFDNSSLDLTTGLNFSTVTDLSGHFGYNVGVRFNKSIKDFAKGNLYGNIGMLYSKKGADLDNDGIGLITGKSNLTINYLEFPIHAGGSYPIGKKVSLFADAGPYIAFATSGDLRGEENIFSDNGFKKIDLGLGFRFGLAFKEKVRLSFEYESGLVNINNGSETGIFRPDNSSIANIKNLNFMINLSWRIWHK